MGATIDRVIAGRDVDLGFAVKRMLPGAADAGPRFVGPFVFWDHFGPSTLEVGKGIDVRPHPHIGIATITYLFEGSLLHKDSLGNDRAIEPGEVNWMLAGRGIVHSERTPAAHRARGARVHGIQTWVALPKAHEGDAPLFQHHTAGTMPLVRRGGGFVRVIAGESYGVRSPVTVYSPTLYVEARLDAGGELALPIDHEERAAYVVNGEMIADGEVFGERSMVAFLRGSDARIKATRPSRVMLLGGAPIDGDRIVWWNYVASSPAILETAKRDWAARDLARFPLVPGDPNEFIPLPEG